MLMLNTHLCHILLGFLFKGQQEMTGDERKMRRFVLHNSFRAFRSRLETSSSIPSNSKRVISSAGEDEGMSSSLVVFL